MATIQQRLIAVMKAKGYPQVDARTRKYVVFKRNDGKFYYLGKAGALRVGTTVTGSLSLSAANYLTQHEHVGPPIEARADAVPVVARCM